MPPTGHDTYRTKVMAKKQLKHVSEESDSDSDSGSEGGVLLIPDAVTGSHQPATTRLTKASTFEATKQEVLDMNEVSSSSKDMPSACGLTSPIQKMTTSDTLSAPSTKTKQANSILAPRSIQSLHENTQTTPKVDEKIVEAGNSSRDTASNEAIPKTSSVGKSGSRGWLVLKPNIFAQATSLKEPRPADNKNIQIPPAAPTVWSRAEKSSNTMKAIAKTSRSQSILSLESWRPQPESAAIVTASTASSLAAPTTSYASAARKELTAPPIKAMVTALPKQDTEAERVAKEVSTYRKYHGLSEKSRFTRMAKLSSEQLGTPRALPMPFSPTTIERSTAVYLKGLPPATTYKDLLEHIHCGKIWHTYIDAPKPPAQPTAVAKIAFCTRASAEAFMDDVNKGRYYVRGQRMYTTAWDRRCEEERSDISDTRCIQIKGPANMMEWAWFEREFTAKMDLKITEYFDVPSEDASSKIFQINFAGIFAQSRAVMRALEKDFSDIYKFRYVPDPCADGAY